MTLPPVTALPSDEHLAQLRASGLSDETIQARGYQTITRLADLGRLGFSRGQQGSGLLVPIHGVEGEVVLYQLRRDTPRINGDKALKYETPASANLRLDVPPLVRGSLGDTAAELWITEGVKKSDALGQAGAPCVIGLLGVWGWRRKTGPLGDWEHVALKGRAAFVAFDSDVVRKPQVAVACRRLARFLESRGATVAFVLLPNEVHGAKVGVDDFLMSGHTLQDLKALVGALPVHPNGPESPDLDVTDRNRRTTQAAWGFLTVGPVPLYRLGRGIAQVVEDEFGRAFTDPLVASTMRGVIDQAAQCFRMTRDGRRDVYPPRDLAEMVLLAPDPPVPRLRGIVEVPVFRQDGALRTTPGYDEADELLLRPAFEPLDVPEQPTEADVAEARRLWDTEVLGDFPFADAASKTHAVALALTPMVREMILGPTPLFGIEASIPGSGKGLLLRSVLTPTLGPHGWANTSLPDNVEEVRKAITAYLRESRGGIVFDNVGRSIRHGPLAKALTDYPTWDDRLLGQSQGLHLPVRCVWAYTANNPSLSDEIARRVVPIRLTPEDDQPESRVGFRHSDLTAWVTENRAPLVWALHVLTRNWVVRGCPGPTMAPPFGSYESWRTVVGGILEAAGYAHFLANRASVTADADVDTVRWEDLLMAWYGRHGSAYVSTKELLPLAEEYDLPIFGDSDRAKAQSLGNQLHGRRDRYFGAFRIAKGDGAWRRKWRVEKKVETGSTSQEPTQEDPDRRRATGQAEPRVSGSDNLANLDNLFLRPHGSEHTHASGGGRVSVDQMHSGGPERSSRLARLSEVVTLQGAVSTLVASPDGVTLVSHDGSQTYGEADGDPSTPTTLEKLLDSIPGRYIAQKEDARRLFASMAPGGPSENVRAS